MFAVLERVPAADGSVVAGLPNTPNKLRPAASSRFSFSVRTQRLRIDTFPFSRKNA